MMITGNGQATGLPSGCASLVTIAQALHWFDRPLFYAEVARILRPGGVFAAWGTHIRYYTYNLLI